MMNISTPMDPLIEIYGVLHPPLVLILCISGILGHMFAIGLLTSESNLRQNPTNLLLISMSGSQLALCINFLYSTVFKYGSDQLCLSSLWSFGWAATLLVSVNLSVMVHICGVFHVVALSIIRYISLSHLAKINSSVAWFSYKKCINALVIIYISVLVVCIPFYFQSEIMLSEQHESCVERFPELRDRPVYQLTFSSNRLIMLVNFWLFGSICKLIPCSILCIMTVLLVESLKKIRLMSSRFQNVERDKQYHRTTKMILVIMFIFIVVEFPQGVMSVVRSLTTVPHLDTLDDLFEMLTLLTSCIIFALFCSMNSKIRSAFVETAHRLCLNRFLAKKKTDPKHHLLIENTSSARDLKFIVGDAQRTLL